MENLRFKFRAWDKLNYRFLSMPLVGIDFENDCVNSYENELSIIVEKQFTLSLILDN